jgi:uncharacterized membrane protein YoaT (DUF817 family)
MDPAVAGANRFPTAGLGRLLPQLIRIGWLELQSCGFAAAVFLGLAVAYVLPLPVATYDALLVWCVVVTLAARGRCW